MSLITCTGVSLSYEANVIVSDLNFKVENGMYLCIVGENGSGKSTLIKTLLKLKKPSKGSIIAGEGLKETEIGYLPQQTSAQKDFPTSVQEVVLSGCLNRCGFYPFYNAKMKNLAEKNMICLGIRDLRNHCYRELSGGQQQRVLLARALCATKKMLLLDEPVAGLDPIVAADMYDIIRKLNKEQGITVIMISHDIQSTVKQASHILHMGNKPLFFGTAKDYVNSTIGNQFLGGDSHD